MNGPCYDYYYKLECYSKVHGQHYSYYSQAEHRTSCHRTFVLEDVNGRILKKKKIILWAFEFEFGILGVP